MLTAAALSLLLTASPLTPSARPSLERELSRALAERPSGLWYIPSGVALGGGILGVLLGLASGVDCRLSLFNPSGKTGHCSYPGPNGGGAALLGLGAVALVGGIVGFVLLRYYRAEPNRRIDALEERLRALDDGG